MCWEVIHPGWHTHHELWLMRISTRPLRGPISIFEKDLRGIVYIKRKRKKIPVRIDSQSIEVSDKKAVIKTCLMCVRVQ